MDRLKVLVVDDESRMRKLVKDFLVKSGFEVVEAEDGEQAVDVFYADKDISLIILDVMMPKMNGYDVCRTIRKDSSLRSRMSLQASILELMSIFQSLSALKYWWRGLKLF